MKPLIVNLFGGAGCGKSTTRAGIFNLLKLQGINCEEAIEWIKYQVYAKDTYVPTDQLYIFAKQRKILREIGDQVDVIVCDSPLLLSAIYDSEDSPLLRQLVIQEFDRFNNVNYVINRVKPYNPTGRYQNEQGAREYDQEIRRFLLQNDIEFLDVDGDARAKDVITEDILRILHAHR